MGAVALVVVFAGYGIAFTGYVWLKGYDLSVAEIWSPTGFYRGTWPPPRIPPGQLFPE